MTQEAELKIACDEIEQNVYENLVMFSDIALLLGIKESTAKRWYERRATTKFPEAKAHLGKLSYKVFDYREVRKWHTMWQATRR